MKGEERPSPALLRPKTPASRHGAARLYPAEAPWRWRSTSSHALLPSSPPPLLRPKSWAALTPSGRGAVSLAADVVAGPSAVVAAATLEAPVVDGPLLICVLSGYCYMVNPIYNNTLQWPDQP